MIFEMFDHVRVKDELDPTMEFFTHGCEAIVLGSYGEKYGNGKTAENDDYSLYIKDQGEVSWYGEADLVLIERGRPDILLAWQVAAEKERLEKSNLDWIFTSGPTVLKDPHNASLEALAECFGLNSLWGAAGEGMTYYLNARKTLKMATPYLTTQDKAGWLAFCKTLMKKTRRCFSSSRTP